MNNAGHSLPVSICYYEGESMSRLLAVIVEYAGEVLCHHNRPEPILTADTVPGRWIMQARFPSRRELDGFFAYRATMRKDHRTVTDGGTFGEETFQ